MVNTDWSDAWRGAFRIELRAEAIGLASRGWPVMPGTYPLEAHWRGPVPAHDDWQDRVERDPRRIGEWWTETPYSLLVATGSVVDAVEVDHELGRKAACMLRADDRPAPILALPNGRWVFLTAAGGDLPGPLATRPGVVRHGEGSWVPLPPTPFEHGVVHWRVKPDVWGWRLPNASAMHGVLARAINALAFESAPQTIAA